MIGALDISYGIASSFGSSSLSLHLAFYQYLLNLIETIPSFLGTRRLSLYIIFSRLNLYRIL
jgi:hypothetical protein